MAQDPRRARYNRLRKAGFTTTEARRLRESAARTRIAVRAVEEKRPVDEARFLAGRDLDTIRHDLNRDQVRQDVARLQRTGDTSDQALRDRWSRWMKSDQRRFPKSAERVRQHIKQELINAGRADNPETESLSYGLTFLAIRGDIEPDEIIPPEVAIYERERR